MTGKKIDVVLAANIFEHVLSLKMAQAPAIGRHPRQSDARFRFGARILHLRHRGLGDRSAVRASCSSPCCSSIAGPLAWIPLVMLPIMIAVGFLLQRPLDRAMKRLQAESAARHGVLVEIAHPASRPCARPAPKRACRPRWERSVAATARSGEDVHFWSSLALNASRHRAAGHHPADGGHRRVSDPRRQALGRRAGRRHHAGGPRAGADRRHRRRHHPRDADLHRAAARSTASWRSSASGRPTESTSRARSTRAASPSTTSPSSIRTAPDNALEKVSFQIEPGERVGIIGRVGSGKTTVGRLLDRLLRPAGGQHPDRRRRHPPIRSGRPARRHRLRAAGHRSVLRQAARQHRARQARRRPTTRCSRPRDSPASKASSPVIRSATTCRSPRAAAACPAARSRPSASRAS